MMTIRTAMLVLTLGYAVLVVGACGGGDESPDGGDGDDCQTGSLNCECYDNSTCNDGFTCTEGTCVNAAGSGGMPGGGSGGQASGGTTGTGASGGQGTGGDGSGGESCGDTSNDWENCGTCGRVCSNGGDKCGEGSSPMMACCEGGQCSPYWGPCFRQEDFVTCAEACASIGETCVADGCSSGTFGRTTVAWTNGTAANCETATNPHTGDNWSCDTTLTWETVAVRRCCCTDTP